MKLEVGMYVRTKWGYICELININDFREPNMKYGVEASYLRDVMFIGDEDILKASNNIIDILEEGDYVNGHRVDKVVIAPKCSYVLLEEVGCYVDSQEDIADYEIKSIVTKEMFSNVEYRVETN